MKKSLILFLIFLASNSFALTYQDVITNQIKSALQLTKKPPQAGDEVNPPSIGGATYTNKDDTLSFDANCFKNKDDANTYLNIFVNILQLSPESLINGYVKVGMSTNPYSGKSFPYRWVMKKAKNCTVLIYYTYHSTPNVSYQKYIRDEISYLSKLDN